MSQSYSSNGMTSSGRVFAVGTVGYAKVRSVQGGTNPQIQLRHGRLGDGPAIASCEATEGAEIDMREHPVYCPDGLYLHVMGNPASIDVLVEFK